MKSTAMPRASIKELTLRVTMTAMLLVGLTVGSSWGAAPRPCRTNGGYSVQNLLPSSYSYIQNQAGSTTGSFIVFSPQNVQTTGGCETGMTPVFGNTGSSTIGVGISLESITDIATGDPVNAATSAAISGSLLFSPASFTFLLGGTGMSPIFPNQTVNLSFTNNSTIAPGSYDIVFRASSNGDGVGAGTAVFTLTVNEPSLAPVDTQAPLVEIQSPTSTQEIVLNTMLNISFTATDPEEGGAGTGVTAIAANIESSGGAVNEDLTSDLSIAPMLPVAGGITATSTAAAIMAAVGSYTLTAEATDGASHTGSASVNFLVKLNVRALPPISVPGRQFKAGSTVPVKWTLTDANGAFLPPVHNIQAWIGILPSHTAVFSGDGSSNIRWELDEAGNATQYITNFQIPASPTSANYTVQIYVDDIDGVPALQGSFMFPVSSKGGK
jgi:hypothetical protein